MLVLVKAQSGSLFLTKPAFTNMKSSQDAVIKLGAY